MGSRNFREDELFQIAEGGYQDLKCLLQPCSSSQVGECTVEIEREWLFSRDTSYAWADLKDAEGFMKCGRLNFTLVPEFGNGVVAVAGTEEARGSAALHAVNWSPLLQKQVYASTFRIHLGLAPLCMPDLMPTGAIGSSCRSQNSSVR